MLNQIKKNQLNSQRSVDVTISGTVNPQLVAVNAKAGTRYNQLVSPFLSYLKLDNGSTTNWIVISSNQLGLQIYEQRFVDPIFGSNVNGDGSAVSPFQTITKALTSFSDESGAKPYAIILAPGVTVEPADINWRSNISLIGAPGGLTKLNVNLTKTGFIGDNGTCNFQDFGFNGGFGFIIDDSLATVSLMLAERVSGFNLDYTGGATPSCNFIAKGFCLINDSIVRAGQFVVLELAVFQTTLSLLDSANTSLGVYNTAIVPTIQIEGRAVINAIASTFYGGINGTIASATTPTFNFNTDSNIIGAVTGDVVLNNVDEKIYANITADHDVKAQEFVTADATAGDINVNLPNAAVFKGFKLTVSKVDASANFVNVNADSINGVPQFQLGAQYQSAIIESDGTQYFIVSQS